MKVTWLTQAGLLFENSKMKIMVDPYLTDSLGEIKPDKKRRIPSDENYFSASPDVILITHSHIDHLDIATLERVLAGCKAPALVLCAESAYEKLCALGGDHNYVLLAPHSVWSEKGVTFYSVHAEHSDRSAVGFIIDDGKQTYYISGDTVYNYDVMDDVLDLAPDGVDFAFLPINGKGNNMNSRDAADFAYEIGAKCAIPVHYGTTDDTTPDEFDFEDRIILEPFVETKL
ncbi:MAG: MBL fold metallo-hydrolase [Clostridia bacterium]|nr:MBL fold metallo-hydrolase [Clostridia bacterium]